MEPLTLAIDPGSRVVGYAVFLVEAGPRPGQGGYALCSAGLLKPSMARDDPAFRQLPEIVRVHLAAKPLRACRRIVSLVGEVLALIADVRPVEIVVEVPGGLIGTGAKRGARGSLTTYGLAAGMILQACWKQAGRVIPVTERQWTSGSGNKQRRQMAVAQVFPKYEPNRDPGGDVSDAIALGVWWLTHRPLEVGAQHV